MTREQAKKLLPTIEFWANNGDLWWYSHITKEWKKSIAGDIDFNNLKSNEVVIDDKHLIARQAYALGKPLEYRRFGATEWKPVKCENELWLQSYHYRPAKLKWYELKENIGKAIMVRDTSSENWNIDIFKGYSKNSELPFIASMKCNWGQARLLTENDIAKEPE